MRSMAASARSRDHKKIDLPYFFALKSPSRNGAKPSFFNEILVKRAASKNTRQNSVANPSKKSWA